MAYSSKNCPKGYVSRKSYTYKKKSTGRKVKVKASCVKSRGLRSKGKRTSRVLPKLKKGSLTKYGYSAKNNSTERHTAIKKAIKAYGYGEVIKKLNAVKLLSKNTNPKNSKIYASDIIYIQKNFEKKSKSKRKSKSRRKSKSKRRS